MENLHSVTAVGELAQMISQLAKQQNDMLQCMEGLVASHQDPIITAAAASCYESDGVEIPIGGTDVSKFRERVQTGTDTAGKPVYKWACGNTKEELHRAIGKLLGGSESPQERVSPRWKEYSQEWFETFYRRKLRATTAYKTERLIAKHISPMFGERCVGEITIKDIQQALDEKSSYSKAYVRDIMNILSQIFNAAIEDGYVARSPMESSRVVNTGYSTQNKRKSLSREQQTDIISNLHKLTRVNDRRFMAFLMFTGMRPGEILGLRWEDIDFECGTISIKRDLVFACGKGYIYDCKTESSKRIIPLDPSLEEYLRPHERSGFIICRRDKGQEGEPYTETVATRSWERIKKTIDVHGMTPYVGRHTYATNMSKANIPMRTAITMMGHSDERMLMRHYIHTDNEDLQNAGDMMSSFISGGAL